MSLHPPRNQSLATPIEPPLIIPKKKYKHPKVALSTRTLARRAKLTLREALMADQGELAYHMRGLMLNILSDRRSIKYKAREQIAALELIARILGQMAPTENVIMPMPPEQLKTRLEEIYSKIRGIQRKEAPTPLLEAPGEPGTPPGLAVLATDQSFEGES